MSIGIFPTLYLSVFLLPSSCGQSVELSDGSTDFHQRKRRREELSTNGQRFRTMEAAFAEEAKMESTPLAFLAHSLRHSEFGLGNERIDIGWDDEAILNIFLVQFLIR